MYKVLWIFSPVLLSVYSWLFILHCEARGHVMETYIRQMLISSPLAKKEEPTAVWLTRRSWNKIYSKEVHDLRCCVNSAETFDWLHDKEQILIDFSFCVWHLHTSTVDQWTEAMTQRIKAGNVLNYQGRYTIKCFFCISPAFSAASLKTQQSQQNPVLLSPSALPPVPVGINVINAPPP